MQKYFFVLATLLLLSFCSYSQSVGIGTNQPDSSAAFEIQHASKGLLIPRLNTVAIQAIVTPARGLMVYDSVTNLLMVNKGTPLMPDWKPVGGDSSGNNFNWKLNGNSNTNPGVDFIGTTDNQPLRFRVNNIHAGELSLVNGNLSFGVYAGNNITTGYNNTTFGWQALAAGTNCYLNTAMGYNALKVTSSGGGNTAVGAWTLSSNTFGNSSTAVGYAALAKYKGWGGNTAIGHHALYETLDAQYNTAVGHDAASGPNMGWNNTFVGANSYGSYGTYNSVALGAGCVITGNSQVRFGNSSTVSIGGYVGYSNISDGRFKKNIQESGVRGIDFIMKLRPVTYQLDITGLNAKLNLKPQEGDVEAAKAVAEKENMVMSGFVAQEVEQAAREVGYNFSGVDKPKNDQDFYGLRYSEFVVPMVKAMQEQQQMITDLKKQNEELMRRVIALEKK